MIVYNPLARPVSKVLRFPILDNRDVEIVDSDGEIKQTISRLFF